jgi:hypothetical protein
VEAHRVPDLGLEIAQVGDRRRGDVWDLVRERDQRRALALTPRRPGLVADRLRGRGPTAGGVAAERCTPVFM